ncbi:alpha/beta hydrolase [Macrococcus lamae]|uniref:Alpha/beta hydrolase n=1 Tax=Macrococcus lamae TaxID=198484 RepID=A0A4R6BV95_9STAP|nr:alpha/beta hydrolase [Macrococcus lamae]TDM12269.1 alpha/beta hydrolase [Macrococcus lamae]
MKKMLWIIMSVLWLFVVGFIGEYVIEKPVQITDAALQKKNVKIYHNIVYSKLSGSQLDILMPAKIKKGDKLPLIIWTHGGGYIAGDKKYKNPYLAQLAEKGFIIANINYALAPEYQYPTPIKQQAAASQYMLKNKLNLPIDKNQIIIGGDSAGAQLASQFAAIQTNDKLSETMNMKPSFKKEQLKAVILFGGFYNMKTVRATNFPRIKLFMQSYTGEANWEKDFVPINQMSTTRHVTKDYPPTFLTVGDADPFDSQARELVTVLQKYNIPYKTSFFDSSHQLRHQYQFHMALPESQLTYKKLLMFLRRYTNQTPYDGRVQPVEAGVSRK